MLFLKGNVMVGLLNVKEGKLFFFDLEEFVNDLGGYGFIIVFFGLNLVLIFLRIVVDMLVIVFGKLK